MYIKALELQHYEKDLYLSVRLLEVMDDDQLYKKSELAEMLKLDVRSVRRLLTELVNSITDSPKQNCHYLKKGKQLSSVDCCSDDGRKSIFGRFNSSFVSLSPA